MYALTDKSRTMESDAFFKSIPPDFYQGGDGEGNVEAPTGWFGMVTIDESFREAWDGDQIPASVEDGDYLVTIDNNGLVWAEQGETKWATLHEYHEKVKEFRAWDEQDEDGI
jgi:hypothetical protein